jgi:hypothetical protein
MEHVVDGVARTPKAVAGDLREIHVADRKGRNVAVAIDPQGKLHYGEDNVLGDHAIAILGEQVSDEYLSELREDGVSYLSPARMVTICVAPWTSSAKPLGSRLSFSKAVACRLIDEISLLVYPGIDDLKGVASIFDYAGSPDEKPGMGQSLRHIDCRPENVTGSRKRLEMQSEDTSATRDPLRGCLKSPDSRQIVEYVVRSSFRTAGVKAIADSVKLELAGLFKHPLRIECCSPVVQFSLQRSSATLHFQLLIRTAHRATLCPLAPNR